jgi:carbonic anhydrase/acetyltransferase-like protein (isoleucine patch superfamily)
LKTTFCDRMAIGNMVWYRRMLNRQGGEMKRLIAVLGLLLLTACSSGKYNVNPDGSKPVLYSANEVLRWPLVDGVHQSPSGAVRIYIDPSVTVENDVRLGDGVRIDAEASIGKDVVLFQNVTVGEESEIGNDAIVQGDVKIGKNVLIRGDAKIGTGSIIEDGARIGKYVRIGDRVTVGANSAIGAGSVIGDGATVAKSQLLPQSTRVAPPK